MNTVQIATGVAICLPMIFGLAAFFYYTFRYTRLRRARKDTLGDYLHDFAGGLTRFITRADPPEELHYFRRMLLAFAFFAAYVMVIMAVVKGEG